MHGDNRSGNETQLKSKFASTFTQFYRLDNLWQSAHLHSRGGQLKLWNWDLDKVWAELAPDATKGDFKKFAAYSKFIVKAKTKGRMYNLLLNKEIFLRSLQNKQGKGTEYYDPDDDELED